MSYRSCQCVVWAFSTLLSGLGVLAAAAEPAQPQALARGRVAVKIRMGLKDKEPSDWSGSAQVVQGELVQIGGWRLRQQDSIKGDSWRAGSKRYPPRPGQDPEKMPVGEVGIVVRLQRVTAATRLEITTPQGTFTIKPDELAFGQPASFLKAAVEAERIADSQDLVTTADEEDFPAAATAADGTVYLAYLAFTPGVHFAQRSSLETDPQKYALFAEPAGGDRLWLTTLRGAEFSKPVALTDGNEDLYRPALAVDGQGRVWIFYSKNVGAGADRTGGDWELFAQAWQNGKRGPAVQLTREAGPDIYPAAATDAEGRVWVTWQAFRGKQARILAARQAGEGFGAAFTVADTPANEWCPAIAATASKPAEVTIAWDTYAKGDYDVYARTYHGEAAGAPFAVAATLKYEARPALAYDGRRRLWMAWEESGEKWGKNFGPFSPEAKMGIPLYSQRTVGVRVLDAGKWFEPGVDLTPLWPNKPTLAGRNNKQAGGKRASYVRLGTDGQGRVWLAARCWMAPPILQNQIWHEYATYLGSAGWAGPIFTAGPSNMLDKRPALVADPQGELLLFGSCAGRQVQIVGSAPGGGGKGKGKNAPGKNAQAKGQAGKGKNQGPQGDPLAVNQNLYVTPLVAARDAGEPNLKACPAPVAAAAASDNEPADVARVRNFRTQWQGQTLQVVRGEFHRHTELSGDGGGDGSLEDMWRYGLDAAAMDWIGCGDHDNGGREFPWWITQKTTDIFQLPGAFTPMYTYERSVNYPDGHRNVMFAQRGVRTLSRLAGGLGKIMDETPIAQRPASPDTQMLYHYLLEFDGICASHTSATDMGTDWRDSHGRAEPIVEIYQGDRQNYECMDAPRAPTAEKALGGWRPQGFINLALERGIQFGFECSSDHISTHISYCCVLAEQLTRPEILKALKARHVYGATDNIVADVRWTAGGGEYLMGDEFTGTKPATVRVHFEGTAPFAKVSIIRNNRYVYVTEPGRATVDFTWTDSEPPAAGSYYYVRGEQRDGELVWVSPVWIKPAGK